MKKNIFITAITAITALFMFTTSNVKAQTTAMPLSGLDCNGVYHDLIADLDSGKAVLIHFFMPNCGSCVPPAQRIQAMAKKVMETYPGMVTAYAMPFTDNTDCNYTSGWCFSNGLDLYTPYDSGAAQVAHYGGFGMPTVVLLGGDDHRVMFSTQSFSTSDTLIMRDSILALFGGPTGIAELNNTVSTFTVYPNPANELVSIQVELKTNSELLIDITDITGRQIALISNEKQSKGTFTKQFNTASIPSGNYLIRLTVNGKTATQKLNIAH